jgi:hypothetical protein
MVGMEKRWYQFSLRSVFVLMTVLALSCAIVSPVIEWYEAERRHEIEELRRDFEESKTRFPKLSGEGNAIWVWEVDGYAEPFIPGAQIDPLPAGRNPRR